MEPSIPKKRWRPRLRFTLRALMIAMTLICVFLGYHVQRAHVQREAVAILKKAGAGVNYDWEHTENGFPPPGKSKKAPPGPAWLRKWIGDEYFQDVVVVEWVTFPDTDTSAFASLRNLPHLQELVIHRLLPDYGLLKCPSAEDLVGLNQLDSISFSGLEVNDETMEQIGRTISLRFLDLGECAFTVDGFQHIAGLHNLVWLYLPQTRINDATMAHIGRLRSLTGLELDYTDISDRGVALLEPLHDLEYFSAVGGEMDPFATVPFYPGTISLGDDSLKQLARHRKLTEIRIGSRAATPRRITAQGLKSLQDLPLDYLQLFGADLQPSDFTLFEKITTTGDVLVEVGNFPPAVIKELQDRYPDVEIEDKQAIQNELEGE